MGGVTTPVPPVVKESPTRLPRLVSGPLSGRLSGLTLWMTGPRPSCACAVLMNCAARNRQAAARTARVMLKILFISVSSRVVWLRQRGFEPLAHLKVSGFRATDLPWLEGPGE